MNILIRAMIFSVKALMGHFLSCWISGCFWKQITI